MPRNSFTSETSALTTSSTIEIPKQRVSSASDGSLIIVKGKGLRERIKDAFVFSQKVEPRNIEISPDRIYRHQFPENVVRNQKYRVVTFIFVVLYEQFKFFFNLYFLLVALSQFIPPLQVGYLFTATAPLAFVLSVTILKEAWDDFKRFKRDKEVNYQKYQRLSRRGYESIASCDIGVGDVILMQGSQRVPADMILLRTTDKSGSCFLKTDQLDGETDWKLRFAIPSLQKLPNDENIFDIPMRVCADRPHKDIHEFIGTLSKDGESQLVESLTVENTLWANTVIASSTALGLVIYTGSDTRSMMNTNRPKSKVGRLDNEINVLSKLLFVLAMMLSFLLVSLNKFQGLWWISFVRFLILFSWIIPISLRMNLDMGKTVYSLQMMQDKHIPDTIVRNSTVPEELGRIEYLLTDKTGTLTRNEMEFRKLHLGTICYNKESMDELSHLLQQALSARKSTTDEFDEMATTSKTRRDLMFRIADAVEALALCHNVTPIEETTLNIAYQASSPDEIAIVQWTESIGWRLEYRDASKAVLRDRAGVAHHYEILYVFPFTSEAKRMGIVCRHCASNEVYFYVKGADVALRALVLANDWLDEECETLAREGLRTLVVARRLLTSDVLAAFEAAYAEARIDLQARAARMQAAVSQFLEKDLELLGVTGVEDKLQENVKGTLEALRNAGIKIWMLTGDKVETAATIAVSARLISRQQHVHHLSQVTNARVIQNTLASIGSSNALIIDGVSLQTALDICPELLMSVALRVSAMVCCRCSPQQKADMTHWLRRTTGKSVAAIGDGGNDVSMIQAASVGIGLVGKEGKQASLAADFSIVQFQHLQRLLLWHGRNSYKRSASLAQFVIHRGLIISVIQAVFCCVFYFAPIAIYQGFLLVGYSTIYTMAPVFSLVLDQDVSADVTLLYPELYKELVKGRYLSYKTFFRWMLISVYQGGVILLLAIFLFDNAFVHMVSISFTALILNELLMVALEINIWHPIMVYSEILTLLIYLVSLVLMPYYFDLAFVCTLGYVCKVLIIVVVSCLPFYLVKFLKQTIAPPSYVKLT